MGEQKRIIALYGNSLVMGGIGASLSNQPNLSLHQVQGDGPELARHLAALHPDVLIFDLTTGHPDDIWAWFQGQPHCLLLGIDINRQEVHQWRGQHTRALTMRDLVTVIQQETKGAWM